PFTAHLDTFRSFRDGVLLKTAPGTALVSAYYTMSPAVADDVAASPALAMIVRIVLTPVAWAIEMPVMFGIVLLLTIGGGTALRSRRKKARVAVSIR
ncbi:MAG TPA: hypothetical protein PLJ47_15135, partial [Candidatus Hydrogenedentes bacterium]|nr:hypothetical protein [Candidatus Hydrogenedentota bacterium]